MPKLLVTGAAGFVGSHICALARTWGYEVISLDLPQRCKHLSEPYIACDILDKPNLMEAMAGLDAVIHAAANPNLWAPSTQALYDVNYHGTLNIIEAMRKQHVPTLVHISSDCTLISKKHSIITEHVQTTISDMQGAYCKSKWLAEDAVLKANDAELKTMVINPGIPVGKTCQQAPFVMMLQAFMQGKIKGFIPGRLGLVDVDDVSLVSLQALTKGDGGQRYLAVSQTLGLGDLFKLIASMGERSPPKLKVPFWLAHLAAHVEEVKANFTGEAPLATKAGIYLAQYTRQLDASYPQQSLNVEFKDIKPALASMVAYNQSLANI